jgi:hypothetical protein
MTDTSIDASANCSLGALMVLALSNHSADNFPFEFASLKVVL